MQEDEVVESSDRVEADQQEPEKRRYSSEEVADIIRLSLQDQGHKADDSVDYDELLAIAREVGVDAEEVDRAVHLLEEQQTAKDKEAYLWSRFRTHFNIFIGVNLLCITINVLGSSETFWSMYMLFGWGLFLLGHYAGLLYAPQFVELAMERTRSLANDKYQEFFTEDGTLSFKVLDNWELTETNGLINLEEDGLSIEYQSNDSLLGLWQSKVKSMELPFADIASIKLDRKLWTADLVIQGKRMRAFKNLPGSQGGLLRVTVNRQSHNAAANLVQQVRGKI